MFTRLQIFNDEHCEVLINSHDISIFELRHAARVPLSKPHKSCMPLPHHLCSKLQNAFRARHHQVSFEHTRQNLGILSILLRNGFLISLTRGTTQSANPVEFHSVPEAQRRIWATLKYRDDRPVLNQMELVSMPSKRIFMTINEIRAISSGRRAQSIKPLSMGEIAVIKTRDKENEWLEAREALRLNLAGEVLCRTR